MRTKSFTDNYDSRGPKVRVTKPLQNTDIVFDRLTNPTNSMVANNFKLPETYRLLVDVWLDLGTDTSWTHVFSGTDHFQLQIFN